MSNTPTPKTDALFNEIEPEFCDLDAWDYFCEMTALAKQMERELTAAQNKIQTLSKIGIDQMDKERALRLELTAAREELAEWSILNGWGGTPEIINDFIKGQQTRIYYERNLEEDLTLAQEEIDILKSKYADHHTEAERITSEIKTVTEQRDRLAEALRKIKNAGGTHNDPYDELDFIDGITYETLQSLNQPTEL